MKVSHPNFSSFLALVWPGPWVPFRQPSQLTNRSFQNPFGTSWRTSWSNVNDLFHPPNLLEYPALETGLNHIYIIWFWCFSETFTRLGKLLDMGTGCWFDLALIPPLHILFSLQPSPLLIENPLQLVLVHALRVGAEQLVQDISKCRSSHVCGLVAFLG